MNAENSPILVVDDDREVRSAIADLLTEEGHLVVQAANGQEALDSIECAAPALILLDMNMPVLDGWCFARRLRERGYRLPTVVMTAAEMARQSAEEIQADGYLGKPFNLADVLETVKRHAVQEAAELHFSRIRDGHVISVTLRQLDDRVIVRIGADKTVSERIFECSLDQWQALRWAAQWYYDPREQRRAV